MLQDRARRLVLHLAALTAVVLAGCGGVAATPGLHGLGAQNRVGGFAIATHTDARPTSIQSPCSRPGSIPSAPGFASGFCVAAEEVTAADLTNTTAQGLRDLASERGYEPFGQQDANGLYRKFRYPGTKQQALRIDQGHIDPDTGLPYDNPNAAVPHGHGYDFSGARVRDPATGDPHFPFQ